MKIQCKYKELSFSGGEGLPAEIRVSNYTADVEERHVPRLCGEFGYLFSRRTFPTAERVDNTYRPENETFVSAYEASEVVNEPPATPPLARDIPGTEAGSSDPGPVVSAP